MTLLVWNWLLSLCGAGLFFSAGAAYTTRRVVRLSVDANARCEAIERELVQRTAERQQLFRELEIERSARLAQREQAVKDTHEMTSLAAARLLEELAVAREQLSRRDSQLEGLRQHTAQLRSLEGELAQATREIALLREQNRVLRAQVFVSRPVAPRPRVPTPLLPATGIALQRIVDGETRSGRARNAVIADELGLLVAASSPSSEYNDALAALGAYLADVGSRTQDILPLRKLQQVIVRDDQDVTLTVRPLATDDPGLALVTLAVEPMSSANDNRQN